jgi:hypothetical protein
MKSHWETHKGKKIFWAIYGNMPMDEYRAEIAAVEKDPGTATLPAEQLS